jgi:hypothetical protein
VETLYSLAGMFTDNEEPKNDCKLDNTSLDASPSTLQEPSETNSPDFFLHFLLLYFLCCKYVVYGIL